MTTQKGRRLAIHHSKTIFNFDHIIWRNNLKFVYNNCMLLFYLLHFLLNFAKISYKKKRKE